MKFEDVKKTFDRMFHETGRVIIGQNEMIKQIVIALLTNSHVLVEGYPGLAKTLTIRTIFDSSFTL